MIKTVNEYMDANTKEWVQYIKDGSMNFIYQTIIPMITDYIMGRTYR
jgi:hypothetical protein